MCELLGFSSQHKEDIGVYLTEFFSHSVTNPNGWGLAGLDDGEVRLFAEPISANDSEILPGIIRDNSFHQTAVAHIRKATIGTICMQNCHPFIKEDCSGRMWTLIHNGTIFSGTELIPYQDRQLGSTDSERILLYLVDHINEETVHNGNPLNSFERFKVTEKVIYELSYRNKINLIIYDGKQMYVHSSMKNTLFCKTTDDSAIFATTPLVDVHRWTPLPLTTLFVYQDGKLKYKGKNHHNEYSDTLGMVPENYDYAI